MMDRLQNFIFRGMLSSNGLEALEEVGILTKATGTLQTSADDVATFAIEDFSSMVRLNAIKMSGVYIAFFCFENAVRELIIERMAERVGANWWVNKVSRKIQDNVKKRTADDGKNRWHAPRASAEIYYTDFGDMADIIVTNWEQFSDLFPGQDWVKTRLGDMEQSRNAIAHNNPLGERDIARIKMYLGDWQKQVG